MHERLDFFTVSIHYTVYTYLLYISCIECHVVYVHSCITSASFVRKTVRVTQVHVLSHACNASVCNVHACNANVTNVHACNVILSNVHACNASASNAHSCNASASKGHTYTRTQKQVHSMSFIETIAETDPLTFQLALNL